MAKKDGNFTETERQRAARWKEETATLPDEARQPAPFVTQSGHERGGPYPFCLPPEFSELSLLPEVRAEALALFAELGIPWHSGVGDGPG